MLEEDGGVPEEGGPGGRRELALPLLCSAEPALLGVGLCKENPVPF